MLRIGVDTGGTFTDFMVVRDGQVTTWKELSTPDDPARAILEGIVRAAGGPSRLAGAEVIHGSTVATNALLEGTTARIAFITNRGFEDLLEIGRQARPDLYDLNVRRPEPLAPRDLRFGIAGRLGRDGEPIEPIDEEEVDRLAGRLRELRIEAAAVCLLHSYAAPAHEETVAGALERAGTPVSVSSRLTPEYREYERASTTAVNAAVTPVVSRYLESLRRGLERLGVTSLRVMGSNGGALSAAAAGRDAARTVLSGPAGGVRAALHVGRAIGRTRLISFDMGGTSTDVCLVPGEIRTSGDAVVAGHPVRVPSIDIHTVGAGGGSIAWRDTGGALRVGPASAGARPGPACYGHGGPPTVTDAHLVLGRLVPDRFLDGRLRLDEEAARNAIAPLAASLGLGLEQAAQGILDVAEATMARAIRVISLHRGHEPADFDLMAFGGAGGLHAASLAASLGIARAIVPARPGVFSAYGMTVADVLKDRSASVLLDTARAGSGTLERIFAELEAACRGDLEAEGVEAPRVAFERTLDARYTGQSHELGVPYTRAWIESFHEEHHRRYGYRRDAHAVEAVTLRVRGIGRVDPIREVEATATAANGAAGTAERPVMWGRVRAVATVCEQDQIPIDHRVDGPAILVETGSTCFVPPGWSAARDAMGHLHLTRSSNGRPS